VSLILLNLLTKGIHNSVFGLNDIKREIERLSIFVVEDGSFSDELSISAVSVGESQVIEVLLHEGF